MSSRRCPADQKASRLGFKERTPWDFPKVLYIVRRINLDIRYFKQLTTNQIACSAGVFIGRARMVLIAMLKLPKRGGNGREWF